MKSNLPLTLPLGLLLMAVTVTHAQSMFTKITTGPIVTQAARSLGTAWVDFDGDGDLDLYVSNGDGANLLYRNDGQGVFTPVANSITSAGPGSFSVSWADIDNDGKIDVLVGRIPGPGLLFQQQADGLFVRSTLATGSCLGAAWADYDGDGLVDLLVTHDGQSALWHNGGQGQLSAVTGAGIDVSGDAVTWVDYDGDGDMDLFVAEGPFSGGGTSRLYQNDGHGGFSLVTAGDLPAQATFVSGLAWGDYDNDGNPDVFLARGNSGQALPSFLFHNNGDGSFTRVQQSPFTDDIGFAPSCSWADYDNDGWLDLFVSESNGTANRLYQNNGDGTFSRVFSGAIAEDMGQCAGSSWGDYDRDGFLDLFVATSQGGGSPTQPDDYLYHNDGNNNAWLTIKCVGTVSNRSAIGAKVRVKATIGGKRFWQLREITTGDGWAGVPLEAHFGLGDATSVETVRIEWPSGTVQELTNVTADQILQATEPSGAAPILSIEPAVILSWPASTEGYILTGANNVGGPWMEIDAEVVVNDGQATVTVKATDQMQFYQLRKP